MKDVSPQQNRKGALKAVAVVTICVWFLIAALIFSCAAQQLAKRLILKDGSYQMATKWDIHGDRVRYYSAERDEWEEVPNSLVDWPATDKYEKQRGQLSPEAIQLNKELEAERAAEEATTPEVSPGLRLEDVHATYLLDQFQGHPELILVEQHGGKVEQDVKKTIFRGVVGGSGQQVTLANPHAEVQAHGSVPSFYVNIGGGPGDSDQASGGDQSMGLPWDRYRIVSLEPKEDKRIVCRIKISSSGKSTQEQTIIKTDDSQLSGGWVKIIPAAALAPGEYALVELLGEEGINTYVWDFEVNPQAPENIHALHPEPPEPATNPELQKRQP
jgi:hypothetical protein